LHAGDRIVIKNGLLEIERCSISYTPMGEDEYRIKIQLAAEEIIENVRAAFKTFGQNLECTLTGGRDSRAIFAALVRAGIKPPLFTRDTDPRDVEISTGLARKYGYTYVSYRKPELLETSAQ